MNHHLASLLVLFGVLVACWGSPAGGAPLETRVSGLAVDVVYVSAGTAQGLAVGLKGTLRAEDGRQAELEVLFTSSSKASCRVSPAGAELRVGDAVWFDVAETVAGRAPASAERELPPAAQAAMERAAAARGLWLRGWWRADATQWMPEEDASTGSRLAVGLRTGLSHRKDVVLSAQARQRSDGGSSTVAKGRLDELALSGTTSRGHLAWQAGRMADGRSALAGPVDGLALESAGSGVWRWGMSAGSRPTESGPDNGRGTGAGGRLRWQPAQGPVSSDLKLRWERDGEGQELAGASVSLQARIPWGLRLEHWQRTEFIQATEWELASRLATSRIRWSSPVWQADLRHQVSTLPTLVPEDEPSGPVVDRERRNHVLEASLARRWPAWWLQLRATGRGDALDGELERRLELSATLSRSGKAWRRSGSALAVFLGPDVTGRDLSLRTTLAPRLGPEWELEGRGWNLEQLGSPVTGWNAGLHARGRLPGRLRWELGGSVQREDGQGWREFRVGLRGDLDLAFQREAGKP
jgi:hypothetical protein